MICELNTGRSREDYAPGSESWSVAFAPDESRFAWSCGFRKVVIIPWNRYKNCLQSQDNQDGDGHELINEKISIDAGFQVYSLVFGTGTPEQDLVPVNRGYWTRFDFSKDLILATGHNNGRIRIWNPFTGKLLLELTDHVQPINTMAFAPDGSLRLVSGSKDSTIKIWDLSDDGNMFKTLKEHHAPVKCVAWSPNSKYLCSTGNKQRVLLWDMETYTLVTRLTGHYHDVHSCAFSPDGAMLATASNDTRVIVWDTHTGEQLRILNHVNPPPGIIYMSGANESAVRGVSFSPNGCHLASICSDGYLRFWNLTSCSEEPEEVGTTSEGDVMLNSCYSPAGGALAVGYKSGSVVFYLAPSHVPSLLHLSRMQVRRTVDSTAISQLPLPYTLEPYLQYKRW